MKRIAARIFRPSFAERRLWRTTKADAHVLNGAGRGGVCPVDFHLSEPDPTQNDSRAFSREASPNHP